MKFIGSVLLLLSLVLFIALPYGVGHGIATHNNKPILIGVVLGAIGFALFFVQKVFDRDDDGHHHH